MERRNQPLIESGSFHDRFAQARRELLRDEDFAHWYASGVGRPSIPPALVAGAFLLALREGCSDREAEQRMRYDLRWRAAAITPPSACSEVGCWRTRRKASCSNGS